MNAIHWLAAGCGTLGIILCGLGYRAYRERDGGVETHIWAGFSCLAMAVVMLVLAPYFQRLLDVLK